MNPRDIAIDAFLECLAALSVVAVPADVEADIAGLSEAFLDDHAFASALGAVASELARMVVEPTRGAPMEGRYAA